MTTASHIVDVLLETDEPSVNIEPDDVNPETYLHQYADQIDKDAREGKLTAQQIAAQLHISKSTLYAYLRYRGVPVGQ